LEDKIFDFNKLIEEYQKLLLERESEHVVEKNIRYIG
jgi:hypothetical protein|tara:strand:+ start:634 stop:744 length:111 start_codon:yes stop_codon:yes gene_type:complete